MPTLIQRAAPDNTPRRTRSAMQDSLPDAHSPLQLSVFQVSRPLFNSQFRCFTLNLTWPRGMYEGVVSGLARANVLLLYYLAGKL